MLTQRSFRRWKRSVAVSLVVLLVVLLVTQTPVSAIDPVPSDLNVGPFVDKIVYKVIPDADQRFLALEAGEIEIDTEFFDPPDLWIGFDPDIDVHAAHRNGYGHITINCEKYPLNISGFRRAFAFAFDKYAVTSGIMNGFSQEHDSLVPYVNGWCVEDEFEWYYYTDQSPTGNQILDDLGFEINVTTGFRNAPNGDSFNITIEYAASSPEVAGGTSQIGVDALLRLHINAETRAADFNEYISRLDSHGDYDMVFYALNFYSNDVDWLAYEYWSENANVPYQNPTNFANETYDSWRNQLLYGVTYEEVAEASSEMQKILQYNVPRLVVYMDTYMQLYRNDQFTGHVEDLGRYISGPWTMRKIQKLDGTFGGTVPVGISQEIETFNFFLTQYSYSSWYEVLLDNLYSSLFRLGPDLKPWPDLAESMLTETHSDNLAVPDGHTRFTIDIVQNATWSDGEPLTAEDVAFTFTYQFESGLYGNPASTDISALVAAYATTTYRVIIEFSTETYWHFSKFAFDYIIPKHIFNDETGIGYDGWYTWNPGFNASEPFVTSGPFIFTDFEAGDFYEISHNPNFHYRMTSRYDEGCYLHPSISSNGNMVYYVGTTENEIVWSTFGSDPDTYSISMNETVRESGSWIPGEIRHNIDGLEIGTYIFSLTILDTEGNSDRDTLHVYVREQSTTLFPLSVLAISISSVSSVTILIVLVSIYRKKKFQDVI